QRARAAAGERHGDQAGGGRDDELLAAHGEAERLVEAAGDDLHLAAMPAADLAGGVGGPAEVVAAGGERVRVVVGGEDLVVVVAVGWRVVATDHAEPDLAAAGDRAIADDRVEARPGVRVRIAGRIEGIEPGLADGERDRGRAGAIDVDRYLLVDDVVVLPAG